MIEPATAARSAKPPERVFRVKVTPQPPIAVIVGSPNLLKVCMMGNCDRRPHSRMPDLHELPGQCIVGDIRFSGCATDSMLFWRWRRRGSGDPRPNTSPEADHVNGRTT
jgi:hypothetical protein